MFTRLSPAALAEQIAQKSSLSPEFWLFNPPSSPKDIKRLEAKLGWPLPEPLAHLLLNFNGGFVSAEGKVSIYSPEEVSAARTRANRFLSCSEIESSYRSLLRAHPDEDPSDFPFIPILQLAEGGFVVVNSSDLLGACYCAWTLDGAHLWRRLYPTLAGLLSDYLRKEGAIITQAYDDEPFAI